MKTFNLATIPGDGIGPEVVTQGLRVLDAIAKKYDLEFKKTNYELGAAYWHKTKETLPDSVMAELAKADVILLGAVGDPTVPSGVLERGLLLKLRFAFEHYINLRPAKLFPGVTSPITNNKGIDFVVVREGTEGLYVGAGSIKDEGTNKELAIEESINTYKGVERVIRDAFNRAMNRPRKKLTLVHKNNVLTRAGGLWTRVFNEVAKDFPDVTTDYLHVDAASMFFVTNPERFDVVVTDNLFGDIITDIAAAICGGIGLAASGNINPTGVFPSMFEPVHGSAPDIAGKNLADPTATVLSIAMMLNHLGQAQAAADVESAVAKDLASRGDKKRSTSEIGDALVKGSLMKVISNPNTNPVPAAERAKRVEEPGFGKYYTDNMVVAQWSEATGWADAKLQPYGPITLDPAAMVFHYGQEIFEGMKAYSQPDGGVSLFRPDANAKRFAKSAARIALPEMPIDFFVKTVEELVKADAGWVPKKIGESLYLRPFMIATEVGLGVRPSNHATYILIATPAAAYFNSAKAVTVWISTEYVRAALGGTGEAKCGGNYAASLLAQKQAAKEGCDQVAYIDAVERKWVEEMGGMNLYFIKGSGKDAKIITPKLTGTLLPGITRDSILTLAKDLGYQTEEAMISIDDWRDGVKSGEITEIFACGTAAVVSAVGTAKSIHGTWQTGDGQPGPITNQIRAALLAIQHGTAEDKHGWNKRVI